MGYEPAMFEDLKPENLVISTWYSSYIYKIYIPDAPCMEYLPTFTLKVSKNDPNVGKYSTHGASGYENKFMALPRG